MKCIICGAPCGKQMNLFGQTARKYPNLCLVHNRQRKTDLLLMSELGDKYAFVPVSRLKDQPVKLFRHPKNFWLVNPVMMKTIIEKLYPLTEEEKKTKREIRDLMDEKEDLESQIGDLDCQIEELEEQLAFDPDREILSTYISKTVEAAV